MSDDINLFDDEPTPTPLVKVLNASKYNVRVSSGKIAPGQTGMATEADMKRWAGNGFLKVVPDAEVTVDK